MDRLERCFPLILQRGTLTKNCVLAISIRGKLNTKRTRVELKASKNQNRGKMEGIRNQRKNDQERIDNFVLVVGLCNWDPCNPIANFFIINLSSGRTEDVEPRL